MVNGEKGAVIGRLIA